MKYLTVLILLTFQIYSQNITDISISYNPNNSLSVFLDRDLNYFKKTDKSLITLKSKTKKSLKTKVLWLKGNIIDIKNIEYDYIIIESPKGVVKLDKNKPILLILDKNKKIMINAYHIMDNYPNVQIFIGDIFTLEINNQIIPLIENFINRKIISKKYKFSQDDKNLKIENLKESKKLEIFNKNWYISKECNSLCKLSFLTYPKYIYSVLYKMEKHDNKIAKAMKNVYILMKQKKYLQALLLTIEIKSKFKTNFDFKPLLDTLKKKTLTNEKYLDIKY